MILKEMINEINEEIDNLQCLIIPLQKAIDENYTKYISEDTNNKIKLENRKKSLQEALSKLQNICEHKWGKEIWDRPDRYCICEICGSCKGDC